MSAKGKNFAETTAVISLQLPPCFAQDIERGISEKLNRMLLKYNHDIGGVMLAYNNVRLLQNTATLRYECPFLQFKISAQILSFNPIVGDKLRGRVCKQSPDHIGLLVHGIFAASIGAKHLKRSMRYNHNGNAWVRKSTDAAIGEDDFIDFEVLNVDKLDNGMISINGAPCLLQHQKQ